MRTIPLKKKYPAKKSSNRPGILLNLTGDLWITIHETANENPGANAKMHADFVFNGGGKSNVSFHFVVDKDGAYQLLPCNEIGYHASDGCDNRATDFGCFASVAIEVCVDDGNVNKAQTRENLIALISMILSGHKDIDFGGIDPKRFSVSRIATHNKWAADKKWCPRHMLNDGYIGLVPGKVRENMAGHNPTPVPGGPFVIGDRLVTTDTLNVRAGYGTRYPIQKTLPKGSKVTVIADDIGAFAVAADGYLWINVSHGSGTGWAASNWMERFEEPAPPPPSQQDEFTIRYPIPLRDAAGFNGKILANEIPVGTTGYVVSGPVEADGMNWYKVTAPMSKIGKFEGFVPQGIMWAIGITPHKS